ncbi:Membrane protein involved in the export of O-antigen, teichoic acid lipoteichoic acids [Methanosarcina siciliae T4/M]|uniref:Membrane protein involved in the export of O-antigen, teichoic acid lipoteichoic acids n=3 Tax=Methanosarcina siciliae TaxID=38027 RepID=A0A0E3LA75_9EURY|nr:flippase [Methanosarcina siciliae]AKB27590.1 Membrane protein involved in the export of O-antigen, teichoic acid lipoteichoic acids [Methanosarcina siciliae T4/M]AKB31531.1 Membrane protein involved in the export of O-antigen, teichoic acid lipoteichoic acids [Methanosarcina siciliae HI350]
MDIFMQTIKYLARNSGFLFLNGITTNILSLFAMLYIARYLGPGDYGIYSFAFAFIYFFSFIPDMGVHQILVREAAKDPEKAGKLIGNGTIMKFFLAFVALLLAFILINVIDFPSSTKNALYIASLGLLISGTGAYGIIYEAKLRMEYSLFFNLLSRICLLTFIFLAAANHSGLNVFVLASVSATLVHNLLMVLFSKKLVKVSFEIDISLIKQLLKEAIPIAVASIFTVVYFKIDVLMLSFLRGDVEVGFYSAAYRLTDALVFLPAAFTTSTFPLMSKYFKDSFDSFSFAYARTFKYLFAGGLLIAVIVTFASEKIILTFYGPEYQESVVALQILIWATAITFISVLISSTCVSSGNQQIISKTSILAAFLNVVLNLILIPSNGYVGAAIATVLSVSGSMIFGLFWIHKYLLHENPLKGAISPLIGTGVVSLLIVLFRPYTDILVLSAASVPIFAAVLYITGWIDSDDKNLLLKLISRNTS